MVKNLPAGAGQVGSILEWGKSPGVEYGNPLQYSCLENPMNRGAWQATVYELAKCQTQRSTRTSTRDTARCTLDLVQPKSFLKRRRTDILAICDACRDAWVQALGREDPLEDGMVTHSSILAWRIPQTEESGGLQSMGLQKVRQD